MNAKIEFISVYFKTDIFLDKIMIDKSIKIFVS